MTLAGSLLLVNVLKNSDEFSHDISHDINERGMGKDLDLQFALLHELMGLRSKFNFGSEQYG